MAFLRPAKVAGEDEGRVRIGCGEHFRAYEPVVDDDIRLLQNAGCFDGQKVRIAWTGADQIHFSQLDLPRSQKFSL